MLIIVMSLLFIYCIPIQWLTLLINDYYAFLLNKIEMYIGNWKSLFRFIISHFSRFPLFDTIPCLSSRQAACFRNNVENGDGTSFASGQIKFQRADALIPTYERERVNSIARERATRHETRTHVFMHARVRVSTSSRMHQRALYATC